jgi:hypothetical protein
MLLRRVSIRVLGRRIVRELWTDNPQGSIERGPLKPGGAARRSHVTSGGALGEAPLLNQSDNWGGAGLGRCKICRQASSDDANYDALHSPCRSTYSPSTSPSYHSQSTRPISYQTPHINFPLSKQSDLPQLHSPSPSLFTFPNLPTTKPSHQFLQNARPRPLQSTHTRLLHLPGLLLGVAGARNGGDQGPKEPGDQESRG